MSIRLSVAVRGLLLWLLAGAAAVGGAVGLTPTVRAAGTALHPVNGGAAAPDGLALALTGVAAVALVACALWWWLVVTLVLVEAHRGGAPVRGVPGWARRLVVGACGLALLGTAPAMAVGSLGATTTSHPAVAAALLSGLPLPDRATDGQGVVPRAPTERPTDPAVPPRGAVVVVRPGDSLWSIAAERVGPRGDDAAVATLAGSLYTANRDVIGPDPDLIHPGQRLRAPG